MNFITMFVLFSLGIVFGAQHQKKEFMTLLMHNGMICDFLERKYHEDNEKPGLEGYGDEDGTEYVGETPRKQNIHSKRAGNERKKTSSLDLHPRRI